MTTILPSLLGTAAMMPGSPCTEHGESMPLASWYEITSPEGRVRYLAVSLHGIYQCSPTGRIHDFFDCLYQRPSVGSHADALRHIGFEVSA